MQIVVQIARFLVQQSLHTLKRRKHKSDLVQLHVQFQGLFVISIYRYKPSTVRSLGAVFQKITVAGVTFSHPLYGGGPLQLTTSLVKNYDNNCW